MIDTVIFDVGMVLAEFCWKEYLESFGFGEEVNERVANATVFTDTWNKFDQGIMDDEEILTEFIAHDPSMKEEITLFFNEVGKTVRVYEDSEEWVRELKEQGYKVYILSNYPKRTYEQSKEKLTFLKYVDGALFSFQDKVIKPAPEIYEILLKRYNINPEQAVFLDDVEKNLKEAENQGIHTIHVTDRAKVKEELKVLLEN